MDVQLYQRFYEIEDWYWWCVGTRRIFLDLIARSGVRGRALDVGCGTGAILTEFPPGWSMVAGCDYAPEALAFCQARHLRDLVRSAGVDLPFATGAFDLVMAIDVIEHLDDDVSCVREMTRICRSGGCVLIHVPAFEILWTDKDDLNHHRRRYRMHQIVDLMERFGLQVEAAFHLNSLIFPIALVRAAEQKLRWSLRERPPVSMASVDPLYNLSPWLNRTMLGVMKFERWLFRRATPPIGMSLVCLARKP